MKLLDIVATKQAFPEDGVVKGQVGTIIEELDDDTVLVEFSDSNGVAYSITPMPVAALTLLENAKDLLAADGVTAAAQMRDFMQTAPTIDADIKDLVNDGRK